jgi:transcriptional regulator with XRE-family HTH domain
MISTDVTQKCEKTWGPVEKRIDKHIGAKLALLRRERNPSQEEFGSILELSQATIHHYEKGNDRISASRLLSIARALESNIAYFYEGAPEWGEMPNRICNV